MNDPTHLIVWLAAVGACALGLAGLRARGPAARAAPAAALIVVGLALTGLASLRAERLLAPDDLGEGLSEERVVTLRAAPVAATTDRGRAVPLYVPAREPDAARLERADAAQLERFGAHRLIRRSPPDGTFNCHGWVFTGGRYWLRGEAVLAVLADNGYRAVPRPRADDLAIHVTEGGDVTHTALVRAVLGDGTVMVEGKWGYLGRFVHAADDHPFGGRVTYYRSGRPGHLLRGLESAPSAGADGPGGSSGLSTEP